MRGDSNLLNRQLLNRPLLDFSEWDLGMSNSVFIGLSAVSPTLVVKTESCLYNNNIYSIYIIYSAARSG